MRTDQLERRRIVEAGGTVLADEHKGFDDELVAWAKETGRYLYIGDPENHTGHKRSSGTTLSRSPSTAEPKLLLRAILLKRSRGRLSDNTSSRAHGRGVRLNTPADAALEEVIPVKPQRGAKRN